MSATAVAAVLAAIALWGGLSAQMAAGGDPVLGDRAVTSTRSMVSPTSSAATTANPSGGSGDDGELESRTRGEVEDDGVIVVGSAPATQAPAPLAAQAPAPAPVQTTTS